MSSTARRAPIRPDARPGRLQRPIGHARPRHHVEDPREVVAEPLVGVALARRRDRTTSARWNRSRRPGGSSRVSPGSARRSVRLDQPRQPPAQPPVGEPRGAAQRPIVPEHRQHEAVARGLVPPREIERQDRRAPSPVLGRPAGGGGDAVEHAVHERRRLGRAEPLRELDRLVDDDLDRARRGTRAARTRPSRRMLRSTRDIRSIRQFFDARRDQLVDLGASCRRRPRPARAANVCAAGSSSSSNSEAHAVAAPATSVDGSPSRA